MTHTLGAFLTLARDSLSDPQGTARKVLAMPYPRAFWWQALGLILVVSVLLTVLMNLLLLSPINPVFFGFTNAPMGMLMVQVVLTLVMIYAMYHVGRVMGGTGSFDGALRITVWLHFVMLVLQVAQTLVLLLVPAFAGLTGLVIMGLNMWLLTNFVAALHGFRSLGKVFGMIIVTFFVASFFIILVFNLLGFGLPVELSDV